MTHYQAAVALIRACDQCRALMRAGRFTIHDGYNAMAAFKAYAAASRRPAVA